MKEIEDAGYNPGRYPAVGIPHDLAERFARRRGGRLPTEAQWEYAARSRGKKRRYVWPDDTEPSLARANIDSMSMIGAVNTIEVGKKEKDRTEQGIFDLTGNVREWCRDLWAAYPTSTEPLTDPQGAPASEKGKGEHIVRGGSFATYKDEFRTTRPRRPRDGDVCLQASGRGRDLGGPGIPDRPRVAASIPPPDAR